MVLPIIVQLIRHAPTQANVERKYLGWSDESIIHTELLPVIDPSIQKVFGSDLKRCIETATKYFPNAQYVEDARFRECHFGDFELLTYEQLKEVPSYQKWLQNYETIAPPNGESLADVATRVDEAFRSMPDDMTKYVIVAHGGSIRTLLMKYAPEEKSFWDWTVKHEEIIRLEWSCRELFKEGKRCTSISVVPIMAKENTSNDC